MPPEGPDRPDTRFESGNKRKPRLGNYIDWKVQRLRLDTPRLEKLDRDTLKEKSDGTFLWVHLAISDLERIDAHDDAHDKRVARALKALPRDLPEVYDRILRKIKHSNAAERAKFVLQFVVAARRPLTVDELGKAYAIHRRSDVASDGDNVPTGEDIPRDIYDCCEPCVSFDKETNTVSFVHRSAKDFLLGVNHNDDEAADTFNSANDFFGRQCPQAPACSFA